MWNHTTRLQSVARGDLVVKTQHKAQSGEEIKKALRTQQNCDEEAKLLNQSTIRTKLVGAEPLLRRKI